MEICKIKSTPLLKVTWTKAKR